MGYKENKVLHIDLEEFGDNDGVPFFIKMKNPKMMTYSEQSELVKIYHQQDIQKRIEMMKIFFHKNIISWNLLDMDTEKPLDLKESFMGKHVMECIPVQIIDKIADQLTPKKSEETKN